MSSQNWRIYIGLSLIKWQGLFIAEQLIRRRKSTGDVAKPCKLSQDKINEVSKKGENTEVMMRKGKKLTRFLRA